MSVEIERKFLVNIDEFNKVRQQNFACMRITQGYLSLDPERTVRVRTVEMPNWAPTGYLTVKGLTVGETRPEFEFEVPFIDALCMIKLCVEHVIDKTRFRMLHTDGWTWDVDVFNGENVGLAIAEIELQAKDDTFELPPWIGEEVTHDPRYFNSNLILNPYTAWSPKAVV